MKNIVLMGVPRAGKETFVRMIYDNYQKYSLVQGDIIESIYPYICKEQAISEEKTKITWDLNILRKVSEACFRTYISSKPELNFILDLDRLNLESAYEYIEKGYIVIVFGHPNITTEEAVQKIINEYSKCDEFEEFDWEDEETIEIVSKFANYYIDRSKEYQETCKEHNIKFVDATENSEAVLNDLMLWLKERNN